MSWSDSDYDYYDPEYDYYDSEYDYSDGSCDEFCKKDNVDGKKEEGMQRRNKDRIMKHKRLGHYKEMKEYLEIKNNLKTTVVSFDRRNDSRDDIKRNIKLFTRLLRENKKRLRRLKKEKEDSDNFQNSEKTNFF